MNCPECTQSNAEVLPRYGTPTARELERAKQRGISYTIQPGQHCQTCLKARYDFIQGCL